MDLPKDFIEKYQNLLGDEAEDFWLVWMKKV